MQCNNASSSTTTMLCPPEVLKRILLHVTDRQDLAQCTRVNVTWRQVSIPFLYERLRITSRFSSDTNTSKTFLRNEYGRHVRHLYLDMSILEDPQAPHQLLRPLQVQRRTSSLRRKGFKLFPGSTSNAIVDPQRRSSLIEFPMVQPAAAAAAASTTATATAPHPPSPPQQHRQHICFTILAVLQSCARVETVELDFHDRTFNMSKNAVFVFSQWQPTTLKKLHLMHLTRLIITPHLKTLTQWISQRCATANATTTCTGCHLEELEISHCVATLFVTQQRLPAIDLTGVSTIRISALTLWDPVSATNVSPAIRWPTTLRSLTILDSPDWLHQSSDVLSSLPNSLESLTLAITPTPSPCASFFLLRHQQQQQQHRKKPSVLDHAGRYFELGLCEVLAKCAALVDLSVEGFPTLTDALLIYLWERSLPSASSTPLLRSLTMTRNARLCGQDLVDMILLHRGCYATDRIDFSGNSNMDADFLHCVKLTSNYATLNW